MAYFLKYTASFDDIHNTHPANWVVNVYDDQGSATDIPVTLELSSVPLTIERLNNSDDKGTWIIGSQATFRYMYKGLPGEPANSDFFDVDERRFRIEVIKNGMTYGIYYVKPDAAKSPFKLPPYEIALTAVDGLAFLKSVKWNAYEESGRLTYTWLSLYDIIMERGLLQIMDDDTPINVINTLRPSALPALSFLNGLFIHSDRFIDFINGASFVYDVLEAICQQFYMRLFVAQGQIWAVRMQDILNTSFVAESYISGIQTALPLPTIFRTIGPDISSNDGTPTGFDAEVTLFPAKKQVQYDIEFKAINVLPNFDWFSFDGFGFEFWPGLSSPDVQQHGTGTQSDPFTAFLKYNIGDPGGQSMGADYGGVFDDNSVHPGDIIQLSIKHQWKNVGKYRIRVVLAGATPGMRLYLSSSGDWTNTVVGYIDFARSGKKKFGSSDIISVPVPDRIDTLILSGNLQLQVNIFTPTDLNTLDPEYADQGVEIYPIKVGIIPGSSKGVNIVDINNARFSKVVDKETLSYLDTGSIDLSNTIATDASGTPVDGWASLSNPADIQSIERHASDAPIDQYAKSNVGIEARIRSNSIEFWHIFTYDAMPGRKMIQLTDTYDVRSCSHSGLMQEVLPENGADTDYSEIDIEDSQ